MNLKGENTSIYEKIFAEHYFRLLGYVRKYVVDTHVAEDIVQDVFLEVWKNRDKVGSIN